MKKLVSLMFVLTLLIVLSGCGKEKLYVYNWGEYIDPETIELFEEEYNVKVVYDTFDSNETMYTKLKSGTTKYDVVIPSDYMIERLIDEDMLQKLDQSKLSNYANIDSKYLTKSTGFDPNNHYAVPYFWGTVGILYDTTKLTEEVTSWDILWDEDYKDDVFMYDSSRDSFMVALKRNGESMNVQDLAILDQAKEDLITQKRTMDVSYVGDEVIQNMISGNKALAVVYSGDAAYIMSENENMDYAIPTEGTNFWIDSMVIPKDARNSDLAHKFIDFMLKKDIAKMNTEEVMYSSPITDVFDEVIEEDWANNAAYNPDGLIDVFGGSIETEVFKHQGDFVEDYENLWLEVLSAS